MKVKEKITNLKVDLTFDEAIFSYINKIYIEKFSKYIYYCWVIKFVKNPSVQRRKENHKQWVVTKLHRQIFTLIAYIETTNENLVWLDFENQFNFIIDVGKKFNMYKLLTLNELSFCIHGLISGRMEAYLLLVMHENLQFGGGLVLGGQTNHELQCTMKEEEQCARLINT